MLIKYLATKRVLIGITGGIAAYKICELIRTLKEHGAEVKTILTAHGAEFITPLTIHALTGETEPTDAMRHINLARWADVILIAPASANFIAKLANGLADDLLSTVCLATSAPLLVAPAMNQQMWQNVATQNNINILQQREIKILGPGIGDQACGENGPGRMLEPLQLLEHLDTHFAPAILANKHVLITAGPTREAIDPVRFLSNHSSGKMGYALAAAALKLGAKVTLISGPTYLTVPQHANLQYIPVVSAQDMLNAVMEVMQNDVFKVDIFIGCAAVADYTPINTHNQKLKKSTETLNLKLQRTPDILNMVSSLPTQIRPFTIGFAAETEKLLANAGKKLQNKCLDMIIANAVDSERGFNQDNNQVYIISKDSEIHELPIMDKKILAYKIFEYLE